MTVSQSDIGSDDILAVNLNVLIDHIFCIEAEKGTSPNFRCSYQEFTKVIATLFHGNHDMEHVHTALILAEDHLTIILEDCEGNHSDEFMRFIERAIKFIKRYIARILGNTTAVEVAKGNIEEVKTDDAIFVWKGKFTGLVEIIRALLVAKYITPKCDAHFIRTIFKLFGLKKTVNDYYKALRKLEEKAPKKQDDPQRCVALRHLLEELETAWNNKDLD